MGECAHVRYAKMQHPVFQAVLGKFRRRFAPGSEVLWVSEQRSRLVRLGHSRRNLLELPLPEGIDLPNIVLLQRKLSRMFLVEVIGAGGLLNSTRCAELRRGLRGFRLKLVFITASASRSELRDRLHEIAWQTHVWIANEPNHIIHFDCKPHLANATLQPNTRK